jgi:hypothetical protein
MSYDIETSKGHLQRYIQRKEVINQTWITEHQQLIDSFTTDGPLWKDGKCGYWRGELPLNLHFTDDHHELYESLAGEFIVSASMIWASYQAESIRLLRNNTPNVCPPGPLEKSKRKPVTKRSYSVIIPRNDRPTQTWTSN